MFNPSIFRSYDIRGVVPDEFDPAEACNIGRAYAAHTGARRVVVARDMRTTSPQIQDELVRGLTEGGVDVVLIGMATSPMFYFAVHYLKAEGGLMVTASHNPGKYNGIKMTRAEAVPIGGDSGLKDIRDLAEKREWDATERVGDVQRNESIKEAYLNEVCEPGVAGGFKLAIDAGNGMAGMLLEDVMKVISGEAVKLYWDPDGNFPNHEADPLKEENMRDVQGAVRESGADLGVAFDGDADRVFFTDEKGEIIPGDLTCAIIAQEILKEQPGATILYDLRSSRATREAIEEAGGHAKMCKVGHSNIKAQMRADGAVFAGELSGHLYFTPWFAESGLLALMKILKVMKSSGKPISELIAPLRRYAKTAEINFEVSDKEKVLAALKDKYADAEIMELDGVTISYPDWWANVRASNTEPLLRLNMEARTQAMLDSKRNDIEKIISGA